MAKIHINQVISNKYQVVEFIATGGMGAVYKVYDLEKNVFLVMKVLNIDVDEDPASLKRFKREANAYRKLSHPHIVPYYGLEQFDDLVFLLQNFIDGDSLKGILSNYKNKPFPINETLVIMKAICAALGYAHFNGVVHCDVKPGNILIDRGGNIYLADFGIARHADSSTTTMAGAGTPAYMSPEQIVGEEVNPATDVYALGCMLFELLTGRRPFRGDIGQESDSGKTAGERIRYAHLNVAPTDPRSIQPEIPQEAASVILKALAKTNNERFQSVSEFFDALCTAYHIRSQDIPNRMRSDLFFSRQADQTTEPHERIEAEIEKQNIPQIKSDGINKPAGMPKWIYFSIGGIILVLILLSSSKNSLRKSPTFIPTQDIYRTDTSTVLIPNVSPTSPSSPQYTETSTVLVNSAAPVIKSFISAPAVVVTGQTNRVLLSWIVQGVNTINIIGVPQQNLSSVGSVEVNAPSSTFTYTLVAKNDYGEVTKELVLVVSDAGCMISNPMDAIEVMREGPHPSNPEIVKLNNGEAVEPVGRNSTISWLLIHARNKEGWVIADHVNCSAGNFAAFPTINPSIIPTPIPTTFSSADFNLAFISDKNGGMDLFLANDEDIRNARAIKPPGNYTEIRWPSFCGDYIAAEVYGNDPQWIYLLNPSNMKWTSLSSSNTTNMLGVPRCSPDGRYIAYSYRDSSSGNWYIQIDSYQNGNPVFSPRTDGTIDGYVTWSNNSSDFFLMSYSSEQKKYTIYRSGVNQMYLHRTGMFPALSPDGQQLAYVNFVNDKRVLFLENLSTGSIQDVVELGMIKIKNVTYAAGAPVWSADGRCIYFSSAIDGDWDIYRYNTANNSMENITKDWQSNELMPAIKW